MNDISCRLKILMDTLSARKFAERLEMAPTTLQEYLKGRMPPADFIVRVCNQFDVNPAWLLAGEGEMRRGKQSTRLRSDDREDELLVNVVQAAIETAGNVDPAIAKKYAHAVIDVESLILELRPDLPSVTEIKGIFSVITTLEEQIESGALKFKRGDLGKLLDVAIKGRVGSNE